MSITHTRQYARMAVLRSRQLEIATTLLEEVSRFNPTIGNRQDDIRGIREKALTALGRINKLESRAARKPV